MKITNHKINNFSQKNKVLGLKRVKGDILVILKCANNHFFPIFNYELKLEKGCRKT